MRLVSKRELQERFGIALSYRELGRMMDAGTFPMAVALGVQRMAWVESEILSWVEQRMTPEARVAAAQARRRAMSHRHQAKNNRHAA